MTDPDELAAGPSQTSSDPPTPATESAREADVRDGVVVTDGAADTDHSSEPALAADLEAAEGVPTNRDVAGADSPGDEAAEGSVTAADRGIAPLEDPAELGRAVEAILFVVEAPVTVTALAAAIQQPVDRVQAAIDELRRQYDERHAGIEVRDVAGGVRIYTRPAFAPQVELFLQDGQRSRLTQAALETLAVIAYRQPVTRSRVSAIRGVNVDGVVRTLTARGLIVEVGTDPETGGGLFRTTDLFLEKMGLQSIEELPSLAPLLPDLSGMETDEL